mgnify:CR=1 FL=1
MPELRCGMGVMEKNSCRDIFVRPSFFFFPIIFTIKDDQTFRLSVVSGRDGVWVLGVQSRCGGRAIECSRMMMARFSSKIPIGKKRHHFSNPLSRFDTPIIQHRNRRRERAKRDDVSVKTRSSSRKRPRQEISSKRFSIILFTHPLRLIN